MVESANLEEKKKKKKTLQEDSPTGVQQKGKN